MKPSDIQPLEFVETRYSKEFLAFQEEIQKQIAYVAGVYQASFKRSRIHPAEQKRIVMEDKVIRGLQKMLIDRMAIEMPSYIVRIKKPVDHDSERV